MVHRLPLTIISLFAIVVVAALTLGSSPVSGADATALSCPNGAAVVLQGQAPPNEALLAYLERRSVGGGSADRSGRYRIPLKLRERPGIYPVEVRLRSSGAVVGRYECYVDVPLTNQPTPTPEIVVSAAPSRSPTAAQPAAAGAGVTPTSRTAAPTSRTAAPTSRTAAPTSRTAGTSGAARTTATSATASPEPTGTPAVQIIDVRIATATEVDEYLSVQNLTESDFDISGWRIVNASRGDSLSYTFPTCVVPPNSVVDLYSSVGDDDATANIFYWNRGDNVWRVGDVAELRDGSGRLIHSYTVTAP